MRPAAAAASPWREIARLNVRDSAGMDVASVTDGEFYREVMVCGERGTVRIRRADLQFGNGQWQRLFLPLALSPGQCSKAVALQGNGRRIRAIRFDHEAWTPGIRGATLVIRALPHVVPQPR